MILLQILLGLNQDFWQDLVFECEVDDERSPSPHQSHVAVQREHPPHVTPDVEHQRHQRRLPQNHFARSFLLLLWMWSRAM